MKTIIIGAGIAGLSTAFFLAKKGHNIQLFEQEPEVGGLSGFFKVNGAYLEKYYHHSFSGHVDLLQLMRELNIDDKFISYNVKTGFYYKNHIYPFVTPKDLLLFKPLNLLSRFRLGLTSLLMMRIKDWQSLEKKSALEWLNKNSGNEACKVIWEPLLKMKFGDNYEQISAAWLWNRVVDRKRSGAGKDVLGYIKGGYRTLFVALSEKFKSLGGSIYLNNTVEKIVIEDGKCCGIQIRGEIHRADMVISTIPIPSFTKITPSLPSDYIEKLSAINYQGSICLVLQLNKSLSDYYWTNISDPDSPFVGMIEHTNFISPEQYGGKHLVYLTRYTSSQSNLFYSEDKEIYNSFITYLEKIINHFDNQSVEKYWLFRDRFSQPVFVKNYSKILPEYQTPIVGLYLLNTAQIYPQSRSLNSGIAMAHKLITEMSQK